MPVIIDKNRFTLETKNTAYVFDIAFGKYPLHRYYGKKDGQVESTRKCCAFSPYFSATGYEFVPDNDLLEYSGFDSGDFRASSLKIKNKNGDCSTFLEYKSHRVFKGRQAIDGMPCAEADKDTVTLEITLTDEADGCEVYLYYTLFYEEDIISRHAVIKNVGSDTLSLERVMSLTLDLPRCDLDMISLYGKHNMERMYQRTPLHHGLQRVFSRRGASSHQFNPLFALCGKDADNNQGEVYGFNFVYSGNFTDEVEVDQLDHTRVQIGINDDNFCWQLAAGDSFATPEAVMTYTDKGIGQMSRNFHKFVLSRILPPCPFEKRPVVLNTWEAVYFNIDEEVLLNFAQEGVDVGIDMVVMDDGWFGERHDDHRGLGDWFANKTKFKNGLKAFVDKVKAKGIKFGIWIEPEMVNPDSDLYRAHPDWCLHAKGKERLVSRDQLVLDMGNPQVLDYLKTTFAAAFDGIAIDYFKWDMNRHLSNVASICLPADRQGEAAHRHILGVYDLMGWLKERYPNALLENCSGGGGRYDLGMMKYSTMIWTSDNTHPNDRIKIQYSSMLGYPASTMSCHVSNHNNICEDVKQLKFRFDVAVGGALGYEFHLPNASSQVKEQIKEQIKRYRLIEKLIFSGAYYPIANPFEGSYSAYYYKGEGEILLSFLQHTPDDEREVVLKVDAADEGAVYTDAFGSGEYSGSQLKEGVKWHTENTNCNSNLWYFVKK